ACLMARFALGERITSTRAAALALCASGMVVLIAPLAATGIPSGILFALGAAVSWAAGTVYLKWARFEADPVAVTFWQVVIGLVFMGRCLPVFEGALHLWPVSPKPLLGLLFAGLVGSGFAYFLWFDIVRRLPAMTASLGVLSVPVVGVLLSVLLLGERPTVSDMVGFALIFAASAVVQLAPASALARKVGSARGSGLPDPRAVADRGQARDRCRVTHLQTHLTAIGDTVDPVAPLILSGAMKNANSCTLFATISSSFRFSRRCTP